jgi:hypothetical protein
VELLRADIIDLEIELRETKDSKGAHLDNKTFGVLFQENLEADVVRVFLFFREGHLQGN